MLSSKILGVRTKRRIHANVLDIVFRIFHLNLNSNKFEFAKLGCFLGRHQRVVITTLTGRNPPDHRKKSHRKEASGGVVNGSKPSGGSSGGLIIMNN